MATENIFEKIMEPFDTTEWSREMSTAAQDGETKYKKVAAIATLARDFNSDMADINAVLAFSTVSPDTIAAIDAYTDKIGASFELMMNETLLGRGE